MRINNCIKATALLLALLFVGNLHAQNIKDSIAVQQLLEQENQSWNQNDAKAYSQHFEKNGTFTNLLGMFMTGYNSFLQTHDHVFKTIFRGTSLKQQLVSIRFADANVVIVETLTTVSGFSGDGPPPGTSLDKNGNLHTRLLQTLIRTGNDWTIIAYHNVDIKAGIAIPEMTH
jgi:uncharacterized protein (TIGR02246 family)